MRWLTLASALSATSPERIAVHVTNDALRQVRGGHPWIWNGSIVRASPEGRPGDLAVVFDEKRKFAAIGLWDPSSAIAVRILHTGAPQTIDEAFFADRLLTAFSRRQALSDDRDTTGYRLVHGENDHLPGLVIDRYADTLVAKLDTVAWLPHLASVLETAMELADAERLVLRSSRRINPHLPQDLRGSPTLFGDPPLGPVEFYEHGLLFEADVERGQKTGHFLDQRDNRQLGANRCEGASVLDVFCNTGGFSVHAAAGGARSVHSIDVSEHAVEATRRHMELNRDRLGFEATHTAVVADAFEAMSTLAAQHRRFDVVIVDPPSFAPNTAAIPAATRAYRRLTALATELLSPGGTLLQASCSSRLEAKVFHHLVADEIQYAGLITSNVVRTAHPLDHPIGFEQGAYLKALIADLIPAR